MTRQIVSTEHAPKAIGPYSQAILANGFVFCSGQLGLDPATGDMVSGDVKMQAHQAMRNIMGVLEAAGTDLEHVVKTTIFLSAISDFAAVNEVYASYFKAAPPARSTVGGLQLPKGGLVEIEMVAMLPIPRTYESEEDQ